MRAPLNGVCYLYPCTVFLWGQPRKCVPVQDSSQFSALFINIEAVRRLCQRGSNEFPMICTWSASRKPDHCRTQRELGFTGPTHSFTAAHCRNFSSRECICDILDPIVARKKMWQISMRYALPKPMRLIVNRGVTSGAPTLANNFEKVTSRSSGAMEESALPSAVLRVLDKTHAVAS
jgi:hypothetical protein